MTSPDHRHWRPAPALRIAVIAFALLCSRRAAADEASAAPAPRAASWYGWQLFIADGIALGLAAPGAIRLATDPNFANRQFAGLPAVGLIAGGAVYLVGAPLLHFGRDHAGRGAGSLAARLLVPLAVAGLTGLAGRSCPDSDARCHDEAAMTSTRWVLASVLLVDLADALNANEQRVMFVPIERNRGLALAFRF